MNDDRDLNDKDRFLDELLDKGLAKYSVGEPRPGFESRILANIQDERSAAPSSARSFAGWFRTQSRWAGAIAIVVVVAGVFWMLLPKSSVTTIANPPQVQMGTGIGKSNKEVPFTPQPNNIPNTSHARSVITATAQHPLQTEMAVVQEPVRLATFPSPSPLTEQERLLLMYVKLTQRNELVAQSRPDPTPLIDEDTGTDTDRQRTPYESWRRIANSNGEYERH